MESIDVFLLGCVLPFPINSAAGTNVMIQASKVGVNVTNDILYLPK
jgi:hypothetical protein